MNIYLDTFNNTIKLYKKESNKDPSFSYELEFSYSLNTPENRNKAITELLSKEESQILRTEKPISLIVGDDLVAFGLFNLPPLSRFKIKDVLMTRFKMVFPNYQSYYFNYEEYEKKKEETIYFYRIAKKDNVDSLINLFKTNNISVNKVDFFANDIVRKLNSENQFPVARLIIGKNQSELIICKGKLIISINTFKYGNDVLLNENVFLDSAYNLNNDQSLQYAGFIKENFASKIASTDENIQKSTAKPVLNFSKPKELRVLKSNAIGPYKVRNNIRKFYSAILDIMDYYSQSPWFLPIREIETYCDENLFEIINEISSSEGNIAIQKGTANIDEMYRLDIENNTLFNQTVKGERKKFDWAKFLTLEIGKKKKG